jgi:hypothetical protein
MLFDEIGDPLQRRYERIVPEAEIACCPAAAPLDLGRFDNDKPGTAGSELAGIDHVPVGRKALHGRILVHRRHRDPVAQRDVPDRQRREQQGLGHQLSLRAPALLADFLDVLSAPCCIASHPR